MLQLGRRASQQASLAATLPPLRLLRRESTAQLLPAPQLLLPVSCSLVGPVCVQEITLMKYVSRDANITQFYGAVMGPRLMLVAEYMEVSA